MIPNNFWYCQLLLKANHTKQPGVFDGYQYSIDFCRT
ncbi:MAG: hypothetical protein JWQ66_753 [Mucilaginibacter sp.]|nr:hypothetical protein [Mucilaginibacter sp.]